MGVSPAIRKLAPEKQLPCRSSRPCHRPTGRYQMVTDGLPVIRPEPNGEPAYSTFRWALIRSGCLPCFETALENQSGLDTRCQMERGRTRWLDRDGQIAYLVHRWDLMDVLAPPDARLKASRRTTRNQTSDSERSDTCGSF